MNKRIIQLESFCFFLLGLVLYLNLGGSILWFLIGFLLPDLSMIGYIRDKKIGALMYNLTHNYSTAMLLFVLGLVLKQEIVSYAGLILFSHVGIDRALGFGLKYASSFKDTHIQKI